MSQRAESLSILSIMDRVYIAERNLEHPLSPANTAEVLSVIEDLAEKVKELEDALEEAEAKIGDAEAGRAGRRGVLLLNTEMQKSHLFPEVVRVIDDLTDEIEELKKENEKLKEKESDRVWLQNLKEEQDEKIEELEEEIEGLEKVRGELGEKIEELGEEIEGLEDEKDELEEKIEELEDPEVLAANVEQQIENILDDLGIEVATIEEVVEFERERDRDISFALFGTREGVANEEFHAACLEKIEELNIAVAHFMAVEDGR